MEFKLVQAREYHIPAEEIYLLLLDMCNTVILKIVSCETEVYYIDIGLVKNVTIRLWK